MDAKGARQSKVRRFAVPKSAENHSEIPRGWLFLKPTGPEKNACVGGKHYTMVAIDDCSRMKWVCFLQKKSNTAKWFLSFIADLAVPAGLTLQTIRTDEGGESKGGFPELLDNHKMNHQLTPPVSLYV